MSEIVTHDKKVETIRQLLCSTGMKQQLAMAAPRHLTPERITRIAMTSIQMTPKLLDCTPQSLLGALLTCTQLGLEPDSAGQRAHLIPYGRECKLIIGYKGLKELAERHERVKVVRPPRVVFANDKFDYEYGLRETLVHKPANGQRGEMVAVYAIAELVDAEPVFEVMSKADVDKIRAKAAPRSGPWETDYDEMARKSVMRRLCKYLPSSSELIRAVSLEDHLEAGIPQDIELVEVASQAPSQAAKPQTLDDVVAAETEGSKPAPLSETVQRGPGPPTVKLREDIALAWAGLGKDDEKIAVAAKAIGLKLPWTTKHLAELVDPITDVDALNDILIVLRDAAGTPNQEA